MSPYVPPGFREEAFNCPYCQAYAKQFWHFLKSINTSTSAKMQMSICSHCSEQAFWLGQKLIIPESSIAPMPHQDLPGNLQDDYLEARAIVIKSPRGAAALLRLCLQKLMIELGETGNNINDDIASLVRKGLPTEVQQALDILRVIGNEAVHPGELDIKDDAKTAQQLFDLLNFVVEDRIARPKKIANMFGNLPQSKLKGIADRDCK